MTDTPNSMTEPSTGEWEVRVPTKVGRRRYEWRTVGKFPTMFHASAWARENYPGGNWMIVNPLQEGFYTP